MSGVYIEMNRLSDWQTDQAYHLEQKDTDQDLGLVALKFGATDLVVHPALLLGPGWTLPYHHDHAHQRGSAASLRISYPLGHVHLQQKMAQMEDHDLVEAQSVKSDWTAVLTAVQPMLEMVHE